MDTTSNKYITVAYELYADYNGKNELVEKAPAEHPFQFISGMGLALDAFEGQIVPLQKGDHFDFTLSVEEAYGEYDDESVLELERKIFEIDGKFDDQHIVAGNIVPLMDSEGNRFNAQVVAVNDTHVTVDLNHPLAGENLHFVGKVLEERAATEEELDALKHHSHCGCGDCGSHQGGCSGCNCSGCDCD